MHFLPNQSIIWLLLPFALSGAIAMDIYIPSLPIIMQYFHCSGFELQLTLSIFMYGFGLGQLIFGPVSDCIGRRPVALYAMLTFAIGSFLCMLAVHIHMFILSRLLQSLGACACFVVSFAVVRDVFSGEASAAAYSKLNAMVGFAPIFAPVLGASLESLSGSWQASFGFLATSCCMVFLFMQKHLPETLPSSVERPISDLIQNYGSVLRSRQFRVHALCCATTMVGLFLYCSISPHILMLKFGFNIMEYGMLFGVNALAWMGASWVSPFWVRRFGVQIVILISLCAVVAFGCCMILLDIFDVMQLWHFFLNMVLISLAIGTMMGPAVAVALEPFGNMAGTASAVLGSFQFTLAGIIGQFSISDHVVNCYPLSVPLTCVASSAFIAVWSFQREPIIR